MENVRVEVLDSLESQSLEIGDDFTENEDREEAVDLEFVSEYEDGVRQVLSVRFEDGSFSVVHSVEDENARIDVTQWFFEDVSEVAEKISDETEMLSKR